MILLLLHYYYNRKIMQIKKGDGLFVIKFPYAFRGTRTLKTKDTTFGLYIIVVAFETSF